MQLELVQYHRYPLRDSKFGRTHLALKEDHRPGSVAGMLKPLSNFVVDEIKVGETQDEAVRKNLIQYEWAVMLPRASHLVKRLRLRSSIDLRSYSTPDFKPPT